MRGTLLEAERLANLRLKALSQLTGHAASTAARSSGTGALEILYKLACSPATAPEALALLHELQVHQVEIEIQGEELNRSHAECQSALLRMTQLYDCAPVGCFTVDRDTTLTEANLTGARLLGSERDALLGRPLDGYLTLQGRRALRNLLDEAVEGKWPEGCILELMPTTGIGATVCVSIAPDPASGERFLVTIMKTARW